jgi:hypothetical protein
VFKEELMAIITRCPTNGDLDALSPGTRAGVVNILEEFERPAAPCVFGTAPSITDVLSNVSGVIVIELLLEVLLKLGLRCIAHRLNS